MRPLALLCAASLLSAPLAAEAQDAIPLPAPLDGEPAAFDPSIYEVTDRDASYFDVAGRVEMARAATAQELQIARINASVPLPCYAALAMEPIEGELRLPEFYDDNEAWRDAIKPLFAFEDAVSDLAGAYVATGELEHAACLGRVLDKWAAAEALIEFHHDPEDQQAWFNLEAALFSAGLAWSVVRSAVDDAELVGRVDAWLRQASRNHLAIPGGPSSCCNNHLYRRALHAAIIGTVSDDDELLRYAVGALRLALTEMREDGGFPRELARGKRAIHYQNYALLYLTLVAQVLERQGYRALDLAVDGKSLALGVEYLLELLEAPNAGLDGLPEEQDLRFLSDEQYLTWMEVWLARTGDERLLPWIVPHRPLFSRSAGGHATLYFYEPAD